MTVGDATPDKSKNWMGVVGLIAALLCGTQLIGLIFGILGLGAAKRGQATNRGMSMFAVVWSTVWLVISLGAGVWVAANWDDGRVAVEWAGSAGKDVANIDRAIDEFQDAHDDLVIANIVFDGENYYVGDQIIKAESDDPTINFYVDGNGGYCLEIISGSSTANLARGVQCAGTPREVLAP